MFINKTTSYNIDFKAKFIPRNTIDLHALTSILSSIMFFPIAFKTILRSTPTFITLIRLECIYVCKIFIFVFTNILGVTNLSYTRPSPLLVDVKSLEDPQRLSQEVRKVLSLDKRDAHHLIGDTSKTAYMRIHEVIATVLDKLASFKEAHEETLNKLLLDLSRTLILVKYQQARDQISDRLASNIEVVLNKVIDTVNNAISILRKGGSIDIEAIRRVSEGARALLDSFAVLVYMYSR